VITLEQDGETGEWSIAQQASSLDIVKTFYPQLTHPVATFVFDAKNGDDCAATPVALQKTMSRPDPTELVQDVKSKETPTHCFLVIVAKYEILCVRNLSGERVGSAKKEKDQGDIELAQVVNRNGNVLFSYFFICY
jgi:hypothetical protein